MNAPERVLIGHPFNPPHLMPLVEVVAHPGTDNRFTKTAIEFYRSLGKHPIEIKQEVPGHVANRLQAALNVEAMSLVLRGVLSAEDCDTAVTSSLGMRWAAVGPFMSNIMGGGGGKDSFLRIQKTIGRAGQAWVKDMREHDFEPTDENLEKIDAGVQQWIDHIDLRKAEEQRDEILLALLDIKSK